MYQTGARNLEAKVLILKFKLYSRLLPMFKLIKYFREQQIYFINCDRMAGKI